MRNWEKYYKAFQSLAANYWEDLPFLGRVPRSFFDLSVPHILREALRPKSLSQEMREALMHFYLELPLRFCILTELTCSLNN